MRSGLAILVLGAACQGRAPEPAAEPGRAAVSGGDEGAAAVAPPTPDEPSPAGAEPSPNPSPSPEAPARGDGAAPTIAHAPVSSKAEALKAHAATFDALATFAESRGDTRIRTAFGGAQASHDARRQPCPELADQIRDTMGGAAELVYGELADLSGDCWVVFTSSGFDTLATAFREPDGVLLVAWDIPEG